ncbi:glycine-rich protein [Synoicihabitans lomoniglobus]|uniref:receptor protein-tyrosine kinase n=1 Tax=Synoicihabitans lomoniglobus TaxID=2909285 RepID=A0AAF0CR52_9BACT|nr:glycine rich domain-containing protein [Opitutaceae bacterium LMO-M01]WED66533.1 glycine-rich protein [Opitutaceae bacterium LMO-M01]
MKSGSVLFHPTGTVQIHCIQDSGTYKIEAAGAQGGDGSSAGGKGARVGGMFYLKKGELLKIVAGRRGTPSNSAASTGGGRGGSSMVWTGSSELPRPIKLMISARGGGPAETIDRDDAASANPPTENPTEVPGPPSRAPFSGNVEIDPTLADDLFTLWTTGKGAKSLQSSTGNQKGSDRAGYNGGSFRSSALEAHEGDGYVSVTAISVMGSGAPRTSSHLSPSTGDAVAESAVGEADAPSQTRLPEVKPRPSSWLNLLRNRRPPNQS